MLEGTREGRIYPDISNNAPTLLEQVEKLMEAVYNEQGDSTKIDVISKLREKNKGAELF